MSSLSVSGPLKQLSVSAELQKPLSKSTEAFLNSFEEMQVETPRSKFITSLKSKDTHFIARQLDNACTKLSDLELAVGLYVLLQHAEHIHHIPILARALLQMSCRLSTVSSSSEDGWKTFFSLANPGCEIPYDRLADLIQNDMNSCVVDDAFKYNTVEALNHCFAIKNPALLAAMQSVEVTEGISKAFVSAKEELAYLEFASFITSQGPVGSCKDALSEHAGVFEAVIKFIQLSQNSERKLALYQLFVAKCQQADWKCMRLATLKSCSDFVDLSNELKVPLDCQCLTAVVEHAKAPRLAKLGLGCVIISQMHTLYFDDVKKLFTLCVPFTEDADVCVMNFLCQFLEHVLSCCWICTEQNIHTLFEDSVTTVENFINKEAHALYKKFEKNDAIYACFALGYIKSFKNFARENLAAVKEESGDTSIRTIEGIECKRNFLQVLGYLYNKIVDKGKRKVVFKNVIELIDIKATNSAAEPELKVDNYRKPTSIYYVLLNETFVMLK
ncbi:MAG: hypothetical protein LLF94_11980 [Chlamydiales bacterium]|nr:hypothetical protein [Chlamydiales bacterium]